MPEANDDLRRRILNDEPPAGDTWRAALLARFDASRKKLLVHATLWLLAGVAIMFWGAWLLGFASDMKLMLLAAVVMLIGYETTVLIKLWYWVDDTNIRTLREIKELQLMALGEGGAPSATRVDQSTEAGVPPTAGFWNRVSLPALTWLSVIVLITTTVLGTYVYLLPLGRGGPVAVREEHTRIAADGRCEILTREQHPFAGVTPLETLEIRTDRPLQDPAWREAGLGVLPHSVARDGEAWVYTVRMPQPVFRGQTVDLRSSATVTGLAVSEPRAQASGPPSEPEAQARGQGDGQAPSAKRGDESLQAPSATRHGEAEERSRKRGDTTASSRWTYTSAPEWYTERGPALTINPAWPGPLKRTVTLPAGARVESVSPKPLHQWGDYDGHTFLAFETAEDTAPDAIRITYRLAAATRPAGGAE